MPDDHNYCITLGGKHFCFTPYVNQDGPQVLITIDGQEPFSMSTAEAQFFAMELKLFAREADSIKGLNSKKPATT